MFITIGWWQTALPHGPQAKSPAAAGGAGLEGIWRGQGFGGTVVRDTPAERAWADKSKPDKEMESIRALPTMSFTVSINRTEVPNEYHVQVRPDIGGTVKMIQAAHTHRYQDGGIDALTMRTDYQGRGPNGYTLAVAYYRLNDREWIDISASDKWPTGESKDEMILKYSRYDGIRLVRETEPGASGTAIRQPAATSGQSARQGRTDSVPPMELPQASGQAKADKGKSAAPADLSGSWSVSGDPEDRIVLQQSGDSVQGKAYYRGRQVADLAGYSRAAGTVLAMRRVDNSDLGVWVFLRDAAGNLKGKSLNPDGSERWRGTYERSRAK